MPNEANHQNAVALLRDALARRKERDPEFQQFLIRRDEVLGRYQPIFSPAKVSSISKEVFLDFLLFKNNHHWKGINRQGTAITSNMDRLRKALAILVDESRGIKERLNLLMPNKGQPMVKGLGRAILTPILMIAYPDTYGVWNGTSEAGMRALGIFPNLPAGRAFGNRYVPVNDVLLRLSRDVEVDLWTLDGLWWNINVPASGVEESDSGQPSEESAEESDDEVLGPRSFSLERQLQEFLRENWERTPLASEWGIYEEDGEEVGYEYACAGAGSIDILAHHKTKPAWLVIELKRGRSSDTTLGQVLRYMGWVKAHLARAGEEVKGLIISHTGDQKLNYALAPISGVELMTYEVDFRLRQTGGAQGNARCGT